MEWPPTAKADRLRREALNRRLRRGRWHFITLDNNLIQWWQKDKRRRNQAYLLYNILFFCWYECYTYSRGRKFTRIEAESWDHGVSEFKLGLMWLNKKGFGSKVCLRPSPGACRFEYLEIWIFLLCTKILGPPKIGWIREPLKIGLIQILIKCQNIH